MPPACRFTREQIVAAALAITRERGFDAVTARAIADTLHSSSKVIFSAFSGMDDLLAATIDAADAQYRAYSADFVRDSADPPYKAVGTAYIRFARNEPNLFHLLYMRDRRREDHSGDAENIAVLVEFLLRGVRARIGDGTRGADALGDTGGGGHRRGGVRRVDKRAEFHRRGISAKPVGECVPVGGGAGDSGQRAPLSPSGESGVALLHPAELRAVCRALPRTAADGDAADRAHDAPGGADVSAHAADWLRRDAGLGGGHLPDSGDSMVVLGIRKEKKA